MDAMTDDWMFDITSPPDGERFQGQTAVQSLWEKFFEEYPAATFETEEIFVCGECVATAVSFGCSIAGSTGREQQAPPWWRHLPGEGQHDCRTAFLREGPSGKEYSALRTR